MKYTIAMMKHNENRYRLYGMRLRASSAIGNNQNIILFFMKFAVVAIVLLRFKLPSRSTLVSLVRIQDVVQGRSRLQQLSSALSSVKSTATDYCTVHILQKNKKSVKRNGNFKF